MNSRSDVVISGAGPAGSLVAYLLASAGMKVTLVDRASFPRAKACGGGIQVRALRQIPFGLGDVVESEMTGIRFSYKLRNHFTRMAAAPLVYGVLRSRFDNRLVEMAIEAGAVFQDATTATGIEEQSGGVVLRTERGAMRGSFLVGADGAVGPVGRALNRQDAYFQQVGIYCEIPREMIAHSSVEPNLMRVDWGTIASGYGWVFPKGGTVNVGVGSPVALGKDLREYFLSFVCAEGLVTRQVAEALPVAGHMLPTLTSRTRLISGRVLLVGDAAGMVEPLTGDGISHAFESARIGSNVIADAFRSGSLDLSPYTRLIQLEVADELANARRLMAVLNTFPRLFHDMFKRNDAPWEAFCKVLRGDKTYREFRFKKLGRLGVIWRAIDPFAEWYEARRIANRDARETIFQRVVKSVLGPIVDRV